VEHMVKAASMVGQVITVEPVKRGDPGITMLSRQYGPGVWFGDMNSCCDIPRTLSKFHTTVHLGNGMTPVQKLMDKAYSLFLTDRETPVIGEFVSKVVSLMDISSFKFDNVGKSWWARYEVTVQFPNRQADWMDEYVQRVMPNFDFNKFKQWLGTVRTLDDCLHPPLLQEHIAVGVKEAVVVNDDVLVPKPTVVNLPGSGKPRPIGKKKRRGKSKATQAKGPAKRWVAKH
jgi:hypothetical protein